MEFRQQLGLQEDEQRYSPQIGRLLGLANWREAGGLFRDDFSAN
jgi:hypothetical protein